ncbi:aldehyde dehydrogenase [Halpernia sp.]|uniref:aldehyde dehydrogenase n=1 Tax=Halpernia sp. TaxID=2782209 RepID=UPI003A90E4B1
MDFQEILDSQKKFFRTQKTKDIKFRKDNLEKLKKLLSDNEKLLLEGIYKDFGKSKFDTILTEISFVKKDIEYYIKNLNSLSKPKKVWTNIVNQLGSSKIYPEPLGNTFVIGAWNYPYQLSLSPMVAAMAAGNTCILKPSEIAFYSSSAMAKIINENFPSNYLFVAEGGVPETTELLKLKFDKIFFTGSTTVGKIVYEAAAKNLTPVTLELGGKSPAIVSKNADLDIAAKRIVWGKFLNAGQTCVATDYILVENTVKDELIKNIKKYLDKFQYTEGSEQYTQIINDRNFDRLVKLIDENKVIFGGKTDASKRYIEPTLMGNVNWDDAVMQEEIFGPILPILTYTKFEDALEQISEQEKPLAAYLFTDNSAEKELFTNRISFGGGCINETVMHLGNDNLPFGGVGSSGMGHYHGKFGFDAFSHQKSILTKSTWGEPDLKYPPYTDSKLDWIKKLI